MSRLVLTLAVAIAFAGCNKSADKAGTPPVKDEDTGGAKDKQIVGSKGDADAGVATGSGSADPGRPVLPDPEQRRRGFLDLDGDLEIAAGNIDKDVVKKVVKENTGKLQFCYEKSLLANPGIEGKVIATFTIAAEGSVSDVKAAGVHPEVETCVAECVKAFKFPPSGKKVDVKYPFNFKPA